MNHKTILTRIAEAYATPFEDRTEIEKEMTRCGICYAIKVFTVVHELGEDLSVERIRISIWGDFNCELQHYVNIITHNITGDDYLYPMRQERDFESIYDIHRSDFCLLLSNMTMKEIKELAKPPEDD